MTKSKVVYTYNWKEVVLITREREGTWLYTYKAKTVIDHINKKNGTNYSIHSKEDLLQVGIILGYLVAFLTNECRVSYGDEPIVTNFRTMNHSLGITSK